MAWLVATVPAICIVGHIKWDWSMHNGECFRISMTSGNFWYAANFAFVSILHTTWYVLAKSVRTAGIISYFECSHWVLWLFIHFPHWKQLMLLFAWLLAMAVFLSCQPIRPTPKSQCYDGHEQWTMVVVNPSLHSLRASTGEENMEVQCKVKLKTLQQTLSKYNHFERYVQQTEL